MIVDNVCAYAIDGQYCSYGCDLKGIRCCRVHYGSPSCLHSPVPPLTNSPEAKEPSPRRLRRPGMPQSLLPVYCFFQADGSVSTPLLWNHLS